MARAYLTIDDGPSRITPKFMDYLCSRGIVPVMNFIGEAIPQNTNEALYAIRKGAIIGNHGYSHEHFSEMTLDECRSDIRKTEELIDEIYERANVKRAHRVFRFPYGDKGGENAAEIQNMLRYEFGFERLDSAGVTYPWWKANRLDTDIDMHWSFDFVEYQLSWNNGYTWDSIVKRILDKEPKQGGVLLCEDTLNIVLIHDTEATDEVLPDYYAKILDYVIKLGVEFIAPKFRV